MVDRISDPHSQHKWIAYFRKSNCWLDMSGPMLRYGIAEDRTHILLLALPVEAELVRAAERPHHLNAIAQPMKREHRRRFHFRHAHRHSAHAFAFLHGGIGRLPKHPPGIAEVVPAIVQPRLVDEVEGKVSPPPIVIRDGSLLESTRLRPPRLCQGPTQIFAAESGDLHFVQRCPIEAFLLPVRSEIKQVIAREKQKVTIDPHPAVGGRHTGDFLPLYHESRRPAWGQAVLHHTHASKGIAGRPR